MAIRSAIINCMVKAAEKASKRLIRDFGEVEQLQVSLKGPADFVSTADRNAERTIREELLFARPGYGLLMEESDEVIGDGYNRFIVDPLDGTTNFLHGIPHFAISIALERTSENGQKDLVSGIVYNPISDELFWAERGVGAYLNDKRLRVSARRELKASLVATGMPFLGHGNSDDYLPIVERLMPQVAGIRRFGSAALDLAFVAAGRYEGFFEFGLQPWDIAAGIVLVREAGGFVSDLRDGSIITEGLLRQGDILATNDHLHVPLAKVINPPQNSARRRFGAVPQLAIMVVVLTTILASLSSRAVVAADPEAPIKLIPPKSATNDSEVAPLVLKPPKLQLQSPSQKAAVAKTQAVKTESNAAAKLTQEQPKKSQFLLPNPATTPSTTTPATKPAVAPIWVDEVPTMATNKGQSAPNHSVIQRENQSVNATVPTVTIQFINHNETLPEQFDRQLSPLVAKMRQDPSIRLKLISYSSLSGDTVSAAYRLSLARAKNLRNWLVQNGGIDASRIDLLPRGNLSEQAQINGESNAILKGKELASNRVFDSLVPSQADLSQLTEGELIDSQKREINRIDLVIWSSRK